MCYNVDVPKLSLVFLIFKQLFFFPFFFFFLFFFFFFFLFVSLQLSHLSLSSRIDRARKSGIDLLQKTLHRKNAKTGNATIFSKGVMQWRVCVFVRHSPVLVFNLSFSLCLHILSAFMLCFHLIVIYEDKYSRSLPLVVALTFPH